MMAMMAIKACSSKCLLNIEGQPRALYGKIGVCTASSTPNFPNATAPCIALVILRERPVSNLHGDAFLVFLVSPRVGFGMGSSLCLSACAHMPPARPFEGLYAQVWSGSSPLLLAVLSFFSLLSSSILRLDNLLCPLWLGGWLAV